MKGATKEAEKKLRVARWRNMYWDNKREMSFKNRQNNASEYCCEGEWGRAGGVQAGLQAS